MPIQPSNISNIYPMHKQRASSRFGPVILFCGTTASFPGGRLNEFSRDITETGRYNSQILTSVDGVQHGTIFGLPALFSEADRLAVEWQQSSFRRDNTPQNMSVDRSRKLILRTDMTSTQKGKCIAISDEADQRDSKDMRGLKQVRKDETGLIE
jgi:hypothetical protein